MRVTISGKKLGSPLAGISSLIDYFNADEIYPNFEDRKLLSMLFKYKEQKVHLAVSFLQFSPNYFQGQGITPSGFFVPLMINESSQVLGFLLAWLSFETVTS